jgi:hypothetical protein
MDDKADGSEVNEAKRWFVFCLIIAATCGIIGIAALCVRPMLSPDNAENFEIRMALFLLGSLLTIFAAPFSFLALFALIDWRSIRRQQ